MVQRTLSILHVSGPAYGGVLRYIAELAGELAARGHRSIVAGPEGDWASNRWGDSLRWINLPLDGGPAALWRSARRIAEIVRSEKIDVIHCHYRRPVLSARLANWRGRRVPIVYALHLCPLSMGGVWRFISDFGDHVIAPSVMGRDWLVNEARVPQQRITVVPHGIRLDRWMIPNERQCHDARAALNVNGFDAVAAFVGRFEEPKNVGWVLDVAAECRRRSLNVGFVLCGDGPEAEAIRRRADELNLGAMVKLPGFIDPTTAYHAADLLLLPSRIEGFAYVAAEAAACGVAVLRTRTAGWQETVVEGETGRVTPIDRAAFVETAATLLANVPKLRQMGEAGSRFAREHLALERQVAVTLAVYEKALGRT